MNLDKWRGYLHALETILEVTFVDKTLLLRAMTHRSYLNEHRDEKWLGNNERLEFLGDGVLEMVVTEYLYRNLPESEEGHLTAIRSGLVSARTLGIVAMQLGLNKYVRLSRGEQIETRRDSRRRRYLYANVLEAVIGAIYVDRGMATAEIFVQYTMIPRLETVLKEGDRNWKGEYQALMQARVGITPRYQPVRSEGPGHRSRHTVALYLGNKLVLEATGMSRFEAEMRAAHEALKPYRDDLPEFDEDWL